MKKFILCLLVFACTGLHAQLLVGVFNTTVLPTAATPTFSPAAGAVANPTTVTASSATSGSGCTMYEDTNNPPTTAQNTYSVTTPVTLHAQLRGCVAYNNSAIASAAYTITVPTPSVVHVSSNSASMNFGSGTVTLSSAATAGHALLVDFYCNSGACGTTTVTDNNSNSLTAQTANSCSLTSNALSYAPGYVLRFAYVVPAGGATSLSFAFTGSYSEALVYEVANLATPKCLGVSNPDAYVYGNYNPLPTASPSESPSLGIGTFYLSNGSCSVGSGWSNWNTVSTSGEYMTGETLGLTSTSPVSVPIAGCSGGPDAFVEFWGN